MSTDSNQPNVVPLRPLPELTVSCPACGAPSAHPCRDRHTGRTIVTHAVRGESYFQDVSTRAFVRFLEQVDAAAPAPYDWAGDAGFDRALGEGRR